MTTTDTTTEPEVDETEDQLDAEQTTDEGTEPEVDEQDGDESETFPREYVEKLRKESAGYRERAQKADDLAHRLHVAIVAATGRLASADELEFDEGHLSDPEALTAAIDALLERKPYLATRKVHGDVGQGASGGSSVVDLAGLLRSRAS